jgi:CelD/BcsL family acetyltransferase involved in cellulose biosynthesis
MRVELVDGPGVEAALAEWAELHAADPAATPFVSAGWARAWIAHRPAPGHPWVLLVRRGSALVGVAPLTLGRRGPVRVLGMLGKEPGDYWDLLSAPGDRDAVGAAVAGELARRRHQWDVGLLSCLVPGSSTPRALGAAGLRVRRRAAVPSPAIDLPGTWEEYLGTLPRDRRRNLRRHLRRLDEGEVELHEVDDPAELPAALGRWQDLRARQWDERGRTLTAAHRSDAFRDFLLAVATALVPSGQAMVWTFRVGGEPAGVYVNFADRRAFYWYLGGFDPAHAGLGLGKIAIATGIRRSIECGRARYDFTRGSEPYKYWYGAQDRFAPSLIVGSGAARSRATLAAASMLGARRDRAGPAPAAATPARDPIA